MISDRKSNKAGKTKKDLKIIFMGTPDFAVPSLKALIKSCTVVAVVTRPDSPQGRGHKMAPPPVKVVAEEAGIPVLQPKKVKTDEFPDALKAFGADMFVTCAYGRILTQKVLDVPPMGTVNIHASILPKYRGAAPLWWQVINGEQEVGVTTMLTDIDMDTGDILLTDSIPLEENATMGEVHDRLSEMGAELIIKTIDGMLDGSIIPAPQNHDEATYAPTISKEDGKIDWTAPAKTIHNLVRGMDPFPAAWTTLDGQIVKIFGTKYTDSQSGQEPGTVLGISSGGGIEVAAGSGTVIIGELQSAGTRRMDWRSYINGRPIPPGKVFGT